jgi:hypothetical protein
MVALLDLERLQVAEPLRLVLELVAELRMGEADERPV